MPDCIICQKPESQHGGVGGYAYIVTVGGLESTPMHICSPECLRQLADRHAEHEADFAARVLGDERPPKLVVLPPPKDAGPGAS